MNILFICKYNRFRSKIAEALFNKFNKNKANKAKSAGIIRGSPISEDIIEAASAYGLRIKSKPKGLTTELLRWQNIAVIVANDVPEAILQDNEKLGKKLIVWKIPDNYSDKREDIIEVISQIEAKIKELIQDLNSNKD